MNSLFRTIALPVLAIAVALGTTVGMNVSKADAAWKPTKKVEISVTCKPGCGPDRIARMIQKIWKTQGIVKQDVVVHNKSGGGGAI